ncbi:MAG: PAS domain S-box protein [Sulfuricella sp.]|nr:PAS domain S-box protein [Sulfuricella sp.]
MTGLIPKFWNRLPFAGRLLVTACIALVIAGFVMLYTAARWDARQAEEDLRAQLQDELRVLPPSLAEIIVIGDFSTLQQTLDNFVQRANVARIRYRDTAGTVLESRDVSAQPLAPAWFVAWTGLADQVGEAQAVVGGHDYGTLKVVITAQESINRAWSRLVQYLLILLLAIVLDFVGIWLVLRGGLKPLRTLNDASMALGQGERSVRIKPAGSPEMRRAAHAFNDMANRIEELLDFQREREEALKESESKLRDIAANMGEGVYMLDRDGRVTFANPEAENLLGWPQAELLGKDAHALLHYHADGDPADSCPIRRANFAGQTYRSRDALFVRRGGPVFNVSLVSAPVLKNGEVAGSVVAFYDITERKQYESRLHRFYETISVRKPELSDQIRALLELGCKDFAMNIGIVSHIEGERYEVAHVLDPAGAIAQGDVFGLGQTYCRDTLRQGGPLMIEHAGASEWASHPCHLDFKLEAYIGVPLAVAGSIYGTLNFSSARPSPRPFTATDREFIQLMAQWLGAELERRQVEEMLKRLNETLEQRVKAEVALNREKDHLLIRQSRLAAMGEMIGNIAHQWRQPLNALGLLLGNMQDAYAYNDLDQEYMEASVGKGRQLIDKMSATIDDFRNFFKPDRAKVRFDLAKAVKDALSVVEFGFERSNIAVALKAGQDASVMGFPNEYAQVVLNVLGNAKEAIQERGVKNGKVEVTIDRDDDYAYVAIRDNGGGIPDEIMEKIFDPYFTTREKGTGIGLYMSKMIIETSMNGRMEVRNIDEGVEFRIATPLMDGTANG